MSRTSAGAPTGIGEGGRPAGLVSVDRRRTGVGAVVNTAKVQITHVLTLDEINKGFDLMHKGESIRSVVVY
ncbi:Zn-dependent alcohol dehydrogenase [Azospirillum lipoferum]|uniref:hypothetical protein n=1 Tax=Azospirillum TaxID=191 RepID=UPI00147815BC|nr:MULTISPECIES: hypothetical protein [Azospirillum]MCP1615268.1 Zn-dependent alcohol dehydrogenase [Azospirillum lipoferum]MDW5534044.1 hypothetical protein [Azospirillum sp. NL1]